MPKYLLVARCLTRGNLTNEGHEKLHPETNAYFFNRLRAGVRKDFAMRPSVGYYILVDTSFSVLKKWFIKTKGSSKKG